MSAGTWWLGPMALGRMSNAKISVGSYKVQQALGMSTIPLMRPSTGARAVLRLSRALIGRRSRTVAPSRDRDAPAQASDHGVSVASAALPRLWRDDTGTLARGGTPRWNSPFRLPAHPISTTVRTSWPGSPRRSGRGTHSSRSMACATNMVLASSSAAMACSRLTLVPLQR